MRLDVDFLCSEVADLPRSAPPATGPDFLLVLLVRVADLCAMDLRILFSRAGAPLKCSWEDEEDLKDG